jgi:drug/metabolite transporter (DMT)-like permease
VSGRTPPVDAGRLAVPALLAVTAIWGTTFVIVKNAVAKMPVMDFLAWRFVIATAVMVVVRPRAVLTLDRKGCWRGILLGATLAGGYVAQTYGLRHTSAAASGFITGMFVVFTPLLGGLLLHRRVGRSSWLAVALATVGLGVISLHGVDIGLGEALTLLCALAYALQLVGLGEWSSDHDVYALAVVQLVAAAVLITAISLPTVGLGPPPTPFVWGAVVGTAVLATAVAFLVQTWAQTHISATRASVVMTMEPVFAGLAAVLAGERLGWRVPVGGALVLAAMYLVEVGPRRARRG